MSGLMRNPLVLGLALLLAVGVGFAAWRTQGSTEAPKPTATTAPSR